MATHLPLCSTISISISISISPRPILAKPPPWSRRLTVSCTAGNGERASPWSQGKFDRRNLLVGMGGLYGATNLVSTEPPALADPIHAPKLADCVKGMVCCAPLSNDGITDYKPQLLRKRPAAHLVDEEYIKKYKEAVRRMKHLPADDPRNFTEQANVHCAYCKGAYNQVPQGDKEKKIQIHYNWLFFPWHRWYLYFYERILGELIGDETFALPYWNWDDSKGMAIPPMFADKKSPLWNPKRIDRSSPEVDLAYFENRDEKNKNADLAKADVNVNLREMYVAMSRSQCLEDFYGVKYSTGSILDENSGAGAIERGPHTAVHAWVGKDMGDFATAGRDPLFFSHHANVDRMWSIWRQKRAEANRPKDFDKKDWLDTEFLFYNEKKKLVKVKVRDALDEEKMGYTYDPPEEDLL